MYSRTLLIACIWASLASRPGVAQSRGVPLPSPDSSRAPLVLSLPPDSALAQMKQLAASRFLQALQSGDDALLLAEYSIPDNSKAGLPAACTSLIPAVSALRGAAGRPAGRLPKGQHLPVYFLSPVSVDSAGLSMLTIDVALEVSPGQSKRSPITLVYDPVGGGWLSSSGLLAALCPQSVP